MSPGLEYQTNLRSFVGLTSCIYTHCVRNALECAISRQNNIGVARGRVHWVQGGKNFGPNLQRKVVSAPPGSARVHFF